MQLETILDFKDLIDKEIYAIPTGNNARYLSGDYFTTFKVTKLGRKYVELDGKDNYHPKTGATQTSIKSGYGGNAGYKFFKSKEDVLTYIKAQGLREELQELTIFGSWISNLSDSQVSELLNIIKGEQHV